MPKADLELVKRILHRQDDIEEKQVMSIIKDLEEALSEAEEDDDKPPPVKKQFCIMVSDPKGELEGKDFVGWVLQIPEDDSPFAAEERMIRSAYEFNITPKGRRLPVKTIAEVCESVPTRIAKEQGVWIKTKEPVYVLRTSGKVPLDELKRKISSETNQEDVGFC